MAKHETEEFIEEMNRRHVEDVVEDYFRETVYVSKAQRDADILMAKAFPGMFIQRIL